MSTISSLLLFLLCISCHECNARRLGAIGKESEKKFLLTNKNDEKVSIAKLSVTPKFKPALAKELGEANGDSMVKQSRVDKDDHKPIRSKAKELKGRGLKISGAVQTESFVSVSWRLPRKKRGEQQPGFNLDYSPPKTHPPVHN